MNTKPMIALMLLSMMAFCMVGSLQAEALEISVPIQNAVDEEETNQTASTSLWDSIQNTISRVFDLIMDIILAPFMAIATVFGNWGGALAGWYAPILAIFVIIVIFVMIRLYSAFDSGLDRFS